MANPEHLEMLKQGIESWNRLREEGSVIRVDLAKANLCEEDLSWANLTGANLNFANLTGANLTGANLQGAYLVRAKLPSAKLIKANLSQAHLMGAFLKRANLGGADLTRANLVDANLQHAILLGANLTLANLDKAILVAANLKEGNLRGAILLKTNLMGADLTGAELWNANLTEANLEGANLINCHIYGTSVWNVNLYGTKQSNLIITPPNEPEITVDNLEVAQFIYLLLNNQKIRDIIDTITSKVVLILGRFTPDRKIVLDAIKEEIRHRNLSPVVFDFEKPVSRDLTETISTLAHMARFVIADLTDAKSLPQELQAIVPNLPSVPVAPLINVKDKEYALFEHHRRYPWVLETIGYDSDADLIEMLEEKIIGPAETKFKELNKR